MARELPPFGPYTVIPQWFMSLVAPVLEHSTKWVYVVIWSSSRWQIQKPCMMSMRELARAAGTGKNQAVVGIAVLLAAGLIEAIPGKGKNRKWYLPKIYTPEEAKAKYTDEWRKSYPKWVQTVVPATGTKKPKNPKKCTRNGYAFQDENQEGANVVSIARAK